MRTSALLLVGLLLSLSGCTIEAKGLGAGRSQSSLVSGRVFDSEQNAPVKGATVKTADGKTATTDDNGNFTIEATPGKSVITIEESDHAKGVKEIDVYADAESYVEVFAKPVAKNSTLNATTGGEVSVGEMTVVIPPDALDDEETNTPYSGQVTVEVATVRPESAKELSAFPGKFDGTTVDQMAGSVATQAAASVRLLNAAGRPLKMRGTEKVEIFMPIRPGIARARTRLWRLQEASADWQEVGFTAVRDVFPGTTRPALRTAVSALTWWNAGEPFVKSRIQGCLSAPGTGDDVPVEGRDASVGAGGGTGGSFGTSGAGGASDSMGGAAGSPADAGAPRMAAALHGPNHLAGIQVVATGIGYGYFAEHYTNADGCYDIEVKANDAVAVYAQTRMLRSRSLRVDVGPPGAPQQIEMLSLGARDGDCPGVMQDCGEGCVDTLTDDNNCGGCGLGCFGEGPPDPFSTLVPYHCVYGSCGCDDAQADCGGLCAEIESDVANCGSCGNDCMSFGSGNECVDSTCVQSASCVTNADCASGQTCSGDVCVTGVACNPNQYACNGACVDLPTAMAMGCVGVDGGLTCGGVVCGMVTHAETINYGFAIDCCSYTPDGDTCGVSSTDLARLINPCASTTSGAPLDPTCPSADLPTLGIFGEGCCRPDGQCGVVLSGSEDLGCILNAHVDRSLPAIGCSGGTFGDAGVVPMPDAGL